MTDDWQVVMSALAHGTARGGNPQREKVALMALARLRERVVELEEALSFIRDNVPAKANGVHVPEEWQEFARLALTETVQSDSEPKA